MGNRDALLSSALDCLAEKGYAGTTARDIAGRAGTSLAAIGYHFRSTEQLLAAAIAEGFERWRGELGATLDAHQGLPPERLVAAVGDELTRLFRDERSLFVVFLEGLALTPRSEAVRVKAAEAYEEDRRAVVTLLRAIRGAARADEEVAASTLLAVVDGLFVQHLISPDDAPSPRAVFDLLAPIIAGSST